MNYELLFTQLIYSILIMFLFDFVHGIIIKYFYCKWKHSRPPKNRCHYWDCIHYHDCPYNCYNQVKKLKNQNAK